MLFPQVYEPPDNLATSALLEESTSPMHTQYDIQLFSSFSSSTPENSTLTPDWADRGSCGLEEATRADCREARRQLGACRKGRSLFLLLDSCRRIVLVLCCDWGSAEIC